MRHSGIERNALSEHSADIDGSTLYGTSDIFGARVTSLALKSGMKALVALADIDETAAAAAAAITAAR